MTNAYLDGEVLDFVKHNFRHTKDGKEKLHVRKIISFLDNLLFRTFIAN